MPSITSANVANAIVKLVAADALPALAANLIMGHLVNRSFEPVLAQAGDTVNVPIPPALVANDISEGSAVATQAVNAGNAAIVLNKHKESSFTIPDVTKVLAVPDLLALYLQPAIIAVCEAIETDLLALYPGFTTNAALGTPGADLTETVIDNAETILFNAKVGTRDKYLVVSPESYSILRQLPRFSEAQTYGSGDAIIRGSIGKLKDFNVFRSQLVVKTGSTPLTTHNLAFAKDAIGLVTRRLPKPLPGTGAVAEYSEMGNFGVRIVMSYAPNTLSQQFTVDVLYGCAVLRNAFGQRITA